MEHPSGNKTWSSFLFKVGDVGGLNRDWADIVFAVV